NPSASPAHLRSGPIGLGYRVPMVIASPWTRGGYVCSEVFDHTSSLQFLEKFLAHKTGKRIIESNITNWRRTVCGDLTSVFRPYKGERVEQPAFIDKTAFIEQVNDAQYKDLPKGFRPLTAEELALVKTGGRLSLLPKQEKGTRPACALPYELYVDGQWDKKKEVYGISFRAGNRAFGERTAGSPFYVYAMTPYRTEVMHCRNYAVAAGDRLQDQWALAGFENGRYHLRVYGPNGFYREFKGGSDNPALTASVDYDWSRGTKITGNLVLRLLNTGASELKVMVADKSYGGAVQRFSLGSGATRPVVLDLAGSHHWYDVAVTIEGLPGYEERFAGRVETGKEGLSDPLMGG
ncbi:MAG TPA: phospholipase domain-containing protein, partial [Puia sp.]|nr:phospholipase domain-containing protein [Puia sp.]